MNATTDTPTAYLRIDLRPQIRADEPVFTWFLDEQFEIASQQSNCYELATGGKI